MAANHSMAGRTNVAGSCAAEATYSSVRLQVDSSAASGVALISVSRNVTQRAGHLLRCEGKAFAQHDRCRAVVQSHRDHAHTVEL